MRRLLFVALMLAGCKTSEPDGPRLVRIETEPPAALVRVEGFGECTSPCTIELDAPRDVTIARAGYDAQRIVIEPKQKLVRLILKLSAPTTGVDEEALPEL